MATYQITNVTMSEGGTKSEHIDAVGNSAAGWNFTVRTVMAMILRGDTFFTVDKFDGGRHVPVTIVNARPTSYIRSAPDRTTTDNLLSLPRRAASANYLGV